MNRLEEDRRMRSFFTLGCFLAASAFTITGSAQPGDDAAGATDGGGSSDTILPLPMAARPLVMTPMTVRGDFHVPIYRFGFGGLVSDPTVGFPFIGGGISLTDWIQIDAGILPIIVAPDAEYYSPQISATFAFTESAAPFEIGAKAGFVLPGSESNLYAIQGGLPIRFHLIDNMLRIDTGVFFQMFGSVDGGDPAFGLMQSNTIPFNFFDPGVPAEFTVSIIDNVFVRAKTGLGIIDLTENFFGRFTPSPDELIFIPLGFGGGANIPLNREMIIDAAFDFGFPLLFTPGFPSGADKVQTSLWQINLSGAFHYSIE
jgi:hypothetical protein